MLNTTLDPAMDLLLDLVEDRHHRVQSTVCWLFAKIAKHNYELLTDNQDRFQKLHMMMINGLKLPVRVSASIASIISEVAESLLMGDTRCDTSILSEVYQELLTELQDYVLNDSNTDQERMRARVAGFSAIFNLLQYCPRDCDNTAINFMRHAVDMLNNSTQVDLNISAEELQGFYL